MIYSSFAYYLNSVLSHKKTNIRKTGRCTYFVSSRSGPLMKEGPRTEAGKKWALNKKKTNKQTEVIHPKSR